MWSNQSWNKGKCRCESISLKKYWSEKDYIWNPAKCTCQNGKYLTSIIDNSVNMFDEIINDENSSDQKYSEKDYSEKFYQKKSWFVKQKMSIFYLPFY